MADDTDFEEMPSVHPTVVESGFVDGIFSDACLNLAERSSVMRDEIGPSLVTYSEEFGPIWRADFLNQPIAGRISRIICWQMRDGQVQRIRFAIAQDVPSLSTVLLP